MANTTVANPSAPTQVASGQGSPKTPTTGSTAMVLGSDAYRGALEPSSMDEAWQLAETMASIGYCGVGSPAEALGRIMTGRGIGLSAMQSMRGVYSINGRPGLDAALMHALCLASPICVRFSFVPEESDDTRATFIAQRRGDVPVKHTFTIEDAEKMGVLDRGKDEKAKADNNYTKHRRAMLRARAKSELARLVFPDLTFGMYSREELEAAFPDAIASDPTELAAQLVNDEEFAAEAAAGRVTTVQVAKRDWRQEAADLKARIDSASNRQEHAAVREAISKWDAVDPWRKEVADHYEARRQAREAAKAAKAAPAEGTGPGAAPLNDANLFSGKEPTK